MTRRRTNPRIGSVRAAILGLLLVGCGAVGDSGDRLIAFGLKNFSDLPYSLYARELSFPIPGATGASLLEPCQASYLEMRLRPPFEVRLGPGSLEQTGDGSALPLTMTHADFSDGRTAWWITVERGGAVALRPVADGEDPRETGQLCD